MGPRKMKLPQIVSSRTKPISSPLRSPMKKSSTTITMATASTRLMTKPLIAVVTASDWRETMPELDSERRLRLELLEALLQRFAHHHHVAARHGRDPQADGDLAVVADQAVRRLDVAAADGGDVAQVDFLRRPRADQQRLEVLDGVHEPGGVDRDELRSDLHAAGVGHEVLLPQLVDDHARRNAELRHAVAVQLDVDGLDALAEGLDLGDVLHQQQLAAQQVDELLELGVAVLVAEDRDEDAVDVAVVVDHQRRAGARRQARLGVADLAPQLVPDLGERAPVVLAP